MEKSSKRRNSDKITDHVPKDSWDIVPGEPVDEFDNLVNELLIHPAKGADALNIQNVITSDLVTIYGLSNNGIDGANHLPRKSWIGG